MDCGVCLSGYEDGCTTGYRCKVVRAGSDWKCSECSGAIKKGEKYELASGFNSDDGNSFWQTKTCLICAEIADAFYCNGRWHGQLWESMEHVYDKLTTACFEKLKTVEAKAELRRRWMAWRGIPA
jgi:hypothetical protein